MGDMIELKPGDFAVLHRTWKWIAVKVEKVTALQFKASGEWGSRANTYQRGQVEYAGPEDKARALVERLTSSEALCDDERRRAIERRTKRNQDLIAEARE